MQLTYGFVTHGSQSHVSVIGVAVMAGEARLIGRTLDGLLVDLVGHGVEGELGAKLRSDASWEVPFRRQTTSQSSLVRVSFKPCGKTLDRCANDVFWW